MTADRVLARTTAVLSRINDALDDPFPAAVARLAGVQGSWWVGCQHGDEVVTVGQRWQDQLWAIEWCGDLECLDNPEPDEEDPSDCWADDPCEMPTATDLGLCAHHHTEIVGVDPTLEVWIGGQRIEGVRRIEVQYR